MNNTLCENKSMCLAETNENNRYRCVKCKKLITRLVVHDQVFDERASISLRPVTTASHALELALISAADVDAKYTRKQQAAFDCSIESSTFQKNLHFSVRIAMSNKNNTLVASTLDELKEMNKCGQVLSAVAPIDFNLNDLRLFCDCLKSPSTYVIMPSYAYIIIIVSVLFILINIIYFIVHSNHGNSFFVVNILKYFILIPFFLIIFFFISSINDYSIHSSTQIDCVLFVDLHERENPTRANKTDLDLSANFHGISAFSFFYNSNFRF